MGQAMTSKWEPDDDPAADRMMFWYILIIGVMLVCMAMGLA